jgi:hypothetical protein
MLRCYLDNPVSNQLTNSCYQQTLNNKTHILGHKRTKGNTHPNTSLTQIEGIASEDIVLPWYTYIALWAEGTSYLGGCFLFLTTLWCLCEDGKLMRICVSVGGLHILMGAKGHQVEI